jgi:hypothetical protein
VDTRRPYVDGPHELRLRTELATDCTGWCDEEFSWWVGEEPKPRPWHFHNFVYGNDPEAGPEVFATGLHPDHPSAVMILAYQLDEAEADAEFLRSCGIKPE